MHGFSKLFSRQRRYDDISVSILEHIEERTEELMAAGMPRKEAEQAARREFGNVTLLQERSREEWQWAVLESILADLKLTLRRLKKSPGFAVTVLLTIALGIGANTTVFSVINSVLLKPLHYPDASQLAALTLNAPDAEGRIEVDVCSVRAASDGGWHPHWPGNGSRGDASDEVAAVWHQSARSLHLHHGAADPGDLRGARELSACPSSGSGRSS